MEKKSWSRAKNREKKRKQQQQIFITIVEAGSRTLHVYQVAQRCTHQKLTGLKKGGEKGANQTKSLLSLRLASGWRRTKDLVGGRCYEPGGSFLMKLLQIVK